ncbi:4217_t:CDS:2, partial [Ambispora leptoticha]
MTKVKEDFEHLSNSNLQITENEEQTQVATVTGTALTLQEDGIKMGIGVLAIAPFSELIELLGILSQFERITGLRGTVNRSVKNLNEKVKKDELVKDLEKGKSSEVQGMIEAIKGLEKEIIAYRKLSYYEENIKVEKVKKEDTKKQEKVTHTTIAVKEDDLVKIYEMKELEEAQENDQLITQQEIPPKGINLNNNMNQNNNNY